MKKLYPLKFRPQWMPKAWGGESWDICGFDEEASVVADGFLADNDLPDILETYMGELVGDEVFDWYNLNFPLLIKHLDIQDRLSVQVHPDDETAAERYDSLGKTEFWYVLEAAPTARIYMGFKEDTDAGTLYRKCKDGTAHELLNVYVPQPGDCFYIPAGTVHAAGGGLKIAEVQESSDITFRLYDWGRELNPATRRETHLDEALDCINYRRYDEAACAGKRPDDVRVLVSDPHFVITSLPLKGQAKIPADSFQSCIVLICTEGSVSVETGGSRTSLAKDETLLIPASADDLLLVPGPAGAHLLQIHLPQPPKDDVYDGPEPE